MRAGAKLRAIRQQLGLSFRDVHAASLDVAKKHRQPAFVIPPRSSRCSGSKPSWHQIPIADADARSGSTRYTGR